MLIRNPLESHGAPLEDADRTTLGRDGPGPVRRVFEQHRAYDPTPLVALPNLAEAIGVADVRVKDESQRLGLGSFKALGGAFAVIRLAVEAASEAAGRPIDVSDWRSRAVADAAARMTFVCATAGNHGRSVAHGAQLVGAQSVVFVPADVSEARIEKIANCGANITRVPAAYDDTVAAASEAAEAKGWTVVSDTAWPGYERIPRLVTQGYTLMVHETIEALAEPPTHVFVQAGVGGLAAATAAHLAETYGADRPMVTVVEPARAACLFESARRGGRVRIAQNAGTVMTLLDCCEPSLTAWDVLSRSADAFMTIEDEAAIAAVTQFGDPLGDDPAISASASGAAGLAGLLSAASDDGLRRTIGLDGRARVLLINTEGQ